MDLSLPKNVSNDVAEMKNVRVLHLDHLAQMTDDTLERRKLCIPAAQLIISQVEEEFNKWLEMRKFAPTMKALKKKLTCIKEAELDFQRRKIVDFNNEQAKIVSNRILQKIINQFASHLKDDSNTSNESLELIQKVFQLQEVTK